MRPVKMFKRYRFATPPPPGPSPGNHLCAPKPTAQISSTSDLKEPLLPTAYGPVLCYTYDQRNL